MKRRAGKGFSNHPSSPKEGAPGPQQLNMNVFSMFFSPAMILIIDQRGLWIALYIQDDAYTIHI